MRPFIICSSCKKHEGSTHFYIHIRRFNSIIYKSISFHEFPRDHSIPFQFPPYIPTPFHSILQEREKILKFASYFCYSTFLKRQEKKHSLFHSTKNSTRYKKKKKSKWFSRRRRRARRRGTSWLNDKQNKAGKKERKRERKRDKKQKITK